MRAFYYSFRFRRSDTRSDKINNLSGFVLLYLCVNRLYRSRRFRTSAFAVGGKRLAMCSRRSSENGWAARDSPLKVTPVLARFPPRARELPRALSAFFFPVAFNSLSRRTIREFLHPLRQKTTSADRSRIKGMRRRKDPKDGGKEVAKRRSTLQITWWFSLLPRYPPSPLSPSSYHFVVRVFPFYFAFDAA